MPDTADDDIDIGVTSIYGARTRRGLVALKIDSRAHLLTPSKAREIAAFLVECATAAEGDETLMRVLERGGISLTRASQILMAMRQERTILERRARAEAREAIAFDQERADLGE